MAHAHPHTPPPIFSYGGEVPEALDLIRKERSHALIFAMVAILVALFATVAMAYLLLFPSQTTVVP
ncbi:hypothetical protein [Pendulispora albinea]|uniref:Uncharacterized protein n=1 Tax=Pendulispora albinea TaxID=2741071 RepID=A0ABZ2LP56_9BACT